MDINPNKLTHHSWDVDQMGMEDQILHDSSIPINSLWPTSYSYPLHHQTPPSSSSTQQILQTSSNNFFDQTGNNNIELEDPQEEPEEELGAMKEMMYRIAAMQPVDIDPSTIRKPKRRNIRISDDPQSVAARHRRERISEKIRILQRLVPGGTKMDTASMLDEAIRYVKFLKRQIRVLQSSNNNNQTPPQPHHQTCIGSTAPPPPLGSSTSLHLDQAAAIGRGLSFGISCRGDQLCFNHEVISD